MDDELRRWSEKWQGSGDPVPDIASMVRKARREDVVEAIAGCAATLVLVVVGISGIFYFNHPVMVVPSGFLVAFGMVVPGWLLWRRFRVRKMHGESTSAYLHNLRTRLDEGISVGRTWWPYWLAGGFVAAWVPWKVYVDWEGYKAEPWRLIVGLTGIALSLGVAVGIQVFTRRKNEREALALDTLIAEMGEGDSTVREGGETG